jgi:hypothetical protein
MGDYVTKADLQEALSRYATKQDLRETGQWIVDLLVTEMGTRFGEVNQRLDRMDAARTKAIAEFTESVSKS